MPIIFATSDVEKYCFEPLFSFMFYRLTYVNLLEQGQYLLTLKPRDDRLVAHGVGDVGA